MSSTGSSFNQADWEIDEEDLKNDYTQKVVAVYIFMRWLKMPLPFRHWGICIELDTAYYLTEFSTDGVHLQRFSKNENSKRDVAKVFSADKAKTVQISKRSKVIPHYFKRVYLHIKENVKPAYHKKYDLILENCQWYSRNLLNFLLDEEVLGIWPDIHEEIEV